MAFSTGWNSTVANDYGGDFDWYDGGGGDFNAPEPYDPYKDEGPSQPGVETPSDISAPDAGSLTITDDRPVTPVEPAPLPEMPEMTIVDKAPKPYVFPPEMLIPPGDILQPVPPPDIADIPDMGTIDIVDKRPITERPVIPEGPEITVPPYNPPIIEAPDILEPVPPVVEPEVPEMVITDNRPVVVPPVIPPVIPPYVPPIVEPPYVPPVPPVVQPPVVQTPIMPTADSSGLNPGFIRATPFYNTTNDAQSKYYWGQHGYQYGPTFNAQAYNQVAAPSTPWGVGQVSTPLTGQQITDLIQGKNVPTIRSAPATRVEAYKEDTRIPPLSGQILLPTVGQSSGTTTTTGNTANVDYSKNTQYNQVASALGIDLARQQQEALARGDTETAQRIQSQFEYVMSNNGSGGY